MSGMTYGDLQNLTYGELANKTYALETSSEGSGSCQYDPSAIVSIQTAVDALTLAAAAL